MKTKQLGVLALLLVAGLALAVTAVAELGPGPSAWRGGGPDMGHGPGRMLPLLLRSAELSPEQSARVKEIVDSHRGRFKSLFDELRSAHEAIADRMFSKETLTAADLDGQVSKISALRTELMREGVKTALEVRAVLSPEQLAKVAAAKERLQRLRNEMDELLGDSDAPAFD